MRPRFIPLMIALGIHPPTLLAQSVDTAGRTDCGYQMVWNADNGDGTFTNPVIHADYSDPDAIRVGDDFYMVASSFAHWPGLPILHSRDLVNWHIIGHAAPRHPSPDFVAVQHGNGVWAPSLRYHNGEFYVYFGDPDRGVYLTKARNAAGPWEPLRLIRKVTGWIDPCPFWDDDGNAYLAHAWANSRVGVKSILAVNRMTPDGLTILDDGIVVYVGHKNQPTIEGPKIYKRNRFYYIFAPAGGVKPGWQTVLRSKSIWGPYEDRVVLEQGSTGVNGPHQGAWIDTPSGEDWFLHFQDRYAYGRVVHLQPMRWENDWPVIGVDLDFNGVGEPVRRWRKPDVGVAYPPREPESSDEFDSGMPGLQWQWNGNSRTEWFSQGAAEGYLRLAAQVIPATEKNLWEYPGLMLQKMPAPSFVVTTRMTFCPQERGEKTGLIVFGMDYAYVGIEKTQDSLSIVHRTCTRAETGTGEETIDSLRVPSASLVLRVSVKPEDSAGVIPKVLCDFSYSADGIHFRQIGRTFAAKEGIWVGAKVGLFAIAPPASVRQGFADIDWVRVRRWVQ